MDGTSKYYSPHLRRWFQFCADKHLGHLNADVSKGTEFLTRYFITSKCEYLPLNTARSTLSSILLFSNGNTFVKHPLIQRVLKGMSKLKPALPRCTVTYDVTHGSNYIRTNSISVEILLELM